MTVFVAARPPRICTAPVSWYWLHYRPATTCRGRGRLKSTGPKPTLPAKTANGAASPPGTPARGALR
jgi:hypothetical protein